jgi:hypothetical protein
MVIGKKKLKVSNTRDKDGNKGVFIPTEDWKAFKKELDHLKKKSLGKQPTKEKPSVFEDVKEALHEVALIRQGKIKPKDIKEFLREL